MIVESVPVRSQHRERNVLDFKPTFTQSIKIASFTISESLIDELDELTSDFCLST